MIKYEVKVPITATDLTEKEEIFKFKLNALVKLEFENETVISEAVSKAIQFYNMSSSLVSYPAGKGLIKINRKFTQKTILELKPINN
jgi:hypothetical protein